MSYVVDFSDVSTVGLESSPVADALAGLRANEARYFSTKFGHTFVTVPAAQAPEVLAWVTDLLALREIAVASPALEVSDLEVDGVRWSHVFYESGLAVNALWTLDEGGKRAVGLKLSDGMEVPAELGAFKFARQRSKLAGTIRGSYYVVKGDHPPPALGT
ncbi:phage tail protein [Janibacter melonis]|uniref:Phage tail protein n=1 Tax=Janibacter melonis TaxID=262209 RepID=A0A5P8FR97_9MICO|nr:phage tail protein [Janibacter melonis]QFQ31322.2 phage tail protein [Janibacter melonis]